MKWVYFGNFALNVGTGNVIRVTNMPSADGDGYVRIEMVGGLKAEIHDKSFDKVMKELFLSDLDR